MTQHKTDVRLAIWCEMLQNQKSHSLNLLCIWHGNIWTIRTIPWTSSAFAWIRQYTMSNMHLLFWVYSNFKDNCSQIVELFWLEVSDSFALSISKNFFFVVFYDNLIKKSLKYPIVHVADLITNSCFAKIINIINGRNKIFIASFYVNISSLNWIFTQIKYLSS